MLYSLEVLRADLMSMAAEEKAVHFSLEQMQKIEAAPNRLTETELVLSSWMHRFHRDQSCDMEGFQL